MLRFFFFWWFNIGSQKQISDLADVVEISVGHAFQFLQLRHLVQHLVEVELGTEEIQASVAVGLPETQSAPSQGDRSDRSVRRHRYGDLFALATHAGPSAIMARTWLRSMAKVSKSG